MTTLTGRTEIWAVALQTWKANPLFGYGAAMWDDEFRRAVGMDFAYNAHNQFLQSLSVAGGLGLAGLLVYTLVLFRYAFAANTATTVLAFERVPFESVLRCSTNVTNFSIMPSGVTVAPSSVLTTIPPQ